MTIEEKVILNGGCIVNGNSDASVWKWTEDFKCDLEIMWKINSINSSSWNRFSRLLGNFEKTKTTKESLYAELDLEFLEERKRAEFLSSGILENLQRNKIITEYSKKENILKFRFKNEQIYKCIVKAGNILELYAFMVLNEISSGNSKFYDDIKIGVIVDWDGIENKGRSPFRDTRNEIDIFLMRGLVPIFVSCKNGEVSKEALYELDTVAMKFGGEFAKKVLLTTYISHDNESRKFIIQRAKDMKIELIDGIEHMTRKELQEGFKRRIR